MVTEMMNIGQIPPAILLSLRADKLDWKTALGELCDNAFDAKASRVEIEIGSGKRVVVKDDGIGCSDLAGMLTMGRHFGKSAGLGRYGIGLKNAACWLWGRLEIVSNHKGVIRKAFVNWADLAKQDDWLIPPLKEDVATSDDPIGTKLVFNNVERKSPSFDQIIDELGYIFSPAIRAGKQIVIRSARKQEAVSPWQPPKLVNAITDEFEVNGKGVKLYCGILPEGARCKRFGFHFTHRHRVVKESCSLGAMGHSVTRVCGIVDLDGSWQLTKNKTDIAEDTDALESAIWERCGELIMASEEQAGEILCSELQTQVTDAIRECLSGMLKGARPGATGKTGSQQPTGKGGKHKNAKNTKRGAGSIADKLNLSKLRMLFAPCDNGVLGRVDFAGHVVYLNSDHPRVVHHRETRNQEALADQCLMLLSYGHVHAEQKSSLPFAREYSGFLDMVSSLLAGKQPEIESSEKERTSC